MLFKRFWLFSSLLMLLACSPPAEVEPQASVKESSPGKQLKQASDSTPQLPLTGFRSWQEIQKSGVIRALKMKWEAEASLPRSGSTSLYHLNMLEAFADKHKLKVDWVLVDDLAQMFSALSAHQADIIPRHLTVTPERRKRFSFTLSLLQGKTQLIAKKGKSLPTKDQSVTVSVANQSAYQETINQYFPKWSVEPLDGAINSDDIADLLVNDSIQYSLLDDEAVETLLSYRSDIEVLKTLSETNELAWALNKDNKELQQALNQFIAQHQAALSLGKTHQKDLKQVKKDRLPLRMITRNSPETYFLWRGELVGFEYELMQAFAKKQGLRLEVQVADSYQEMLDLLEAGKGDIIAAGVTRTEKRQKALNFSIRYNRVEEKIVAHGDAPPLSALTDLSGRQIHVRRSSAFWSTANQLAQQYGAIVVAADEFESTELLIAQVAEKKIDLTIADSNLISIEQSFRDEIVTPLTLNEGVPYAYVVRENNPQLLNALNQHIRETYRGTFYNVVKNKYFANQQRKEKLRNERIVEGDNLSPYDPLIKLQANTHGFDWRLITSQMYEESRFNPDAKSNAGAIGLMQVLPRTANELGYSDLTDPEVSIAAGVEYLSWTRERFSTDIPIQERLLFALASYNAGYGHVKDAQKLAKQMNLKSDVWFNHVEKAMLLLQNPKYYKQTRFGYCRGSEPVDYVRDIHQRYQTYLALTE